MLVDMALAQIPAGYIERIGILVRADSAGASTSWPTSVIGPTCGTRSVTR
jgi:hypothetical protein